MAENCIQLRGPNVSARTEKLFTEHSEKCNACDIQNSRRQIKWHPNKKCTVSLIETNEYRI